MVVRCCDNGSYLQAGPVCYLRRHVIGFVALACPLVQYVRHEKRPYYKEYHG